MNEPKYFLKEEYIYFSGLSKEKLKAIRSELTELLDKKIVLIKDSELYGVLEFSFQKKQYKELLIKFIKTKNAEILDETAKIKGLGTFLVNYVVDLFSPDVLIINCVLDNSKGFWKKVVKFFEEKGTFKQIEYVSGDKTNCSKIILKK